MFWLINHIPDVIIHLLFVIGIVGTLSSFFLGMVPFISQYKLPLQVISIIILAFALYSEGSIANNEQWQAKIKEQENKIELAEQKSADLNIQLTEALKNKQYIIREKQTETIKEITKYVTDTCELSNAAVSLHDSSSQNSFPNSSIGTITGTSDVKVPEMLKLITDNYTTYYNQVEKLKAWQEWYKKNKEFFDKAQE